MEIKNIKTVEDNLVRMTPDEEERFRNNIKISDSKRFVAFYRRRTITPGSPPFHRHRYAKTKSGAIYINDNKERRIMPTWSKVGQGVKPV